MPAPEIIAVISSRIFMNYRPDGARGGKTGKIYDKGTCKKEVIKRLQDNA